MGRERVAELINELQAWPGPHINSHKSASQFFHKLVFLADFGIKVSEPGIMPIVDKILANLDENNVPFLKMEIGLAYGGTGQATNAWALCDAPSTLYALIKMGVTDPRLVQGVGYLAALIGDSGFGCHVSASLGTWRGPGKKSDPCPYATLIMIKVLLLFGNTYTREIEKASACLLDLWENSRTKHPYIFYMGNDFRKLKLPFIWYDILHVTEVLSKVPTIQKDRRLVEMWQCIIEKEVNGSFTPESVYLPWKDWDFGQKKGPSPWMTERIKSIGERLD